MVLPRLETLHIICYPDPGLRKKCRPVGEFGGDLEAVASRMLALMHEVKGVGLAAPQVGLPLRLFVWNTTGDPGDDRIGVNPRLADLVGAEDKEEGCLSIPGVSVTVRRATHAVLQARDCRNQPFELAGENLIARVWQHEIDHLEGRLIIDNMSTADEIANRRVLKQLKAAQPQSRRS